MNSRHFSTIRALIPASDWFAVYAIEEEPFYVVSRLHCLVAGRTFTGYQPHTRKFEEDEMDDLAFMEMDDDGSFDDPTNMHNFLTLCHERDITEEVQAQWSKEGKAYQEKTRTKAAWMDGMTAIVGGPTPYGTGSGSAAFPCPALPHRTGAS